MLGGSVYIAFIRFVVSLVGVILIFLKLANQDIRKKRQPCVMWFSASLWLLWDVFGM